MDSELQDITVSSTTSTSSQTYEQPPTTNTSNEPTSLQVNEISSTVSSDLQAVMLSLIGYD